MIVCEGSKDEAGYLRSARSHLRLPSASVVLKSAGGGDPASIVDYAISQRRLEGSRPESRFDEAWVVFDAEEARHSGAGVACEKAERADFRVAVSNPSFEIWLLLHAGAFARAVSAKEAKEECFRQFGIPKRRGERPVFDDARLPGDWTVAATNALERRRLAALTVGECSSTALVVAANPSTNLDELLVALSAAKPG